MKHLLTLLIAMAVAMPVAAVEKPAQKKPATEKQARKVKKHKKLEGTKVPDAPAKKDSKDSKKKK